MAKGSENPFPSVLFAEGAAPITPAAGFWRAYFKTTGLFVVDDAGVETGPIVSVPDASATARGIIELATSAEVVAGIDALRAVTPKTLADNYRDVEIGVACSDESTAIDATGTKTTFRMPYAMTVTGVRASLTGATTTGTVTVDINEAGTTILSTKLTIDATEKTSTTATTATVISDSALADDAEVTVDVDVVGDGTATGLKVWILGTRT